MTNTELQIIRTTLQLTQTQLAAHLDVHPGTVARWEMRSNQGRWPVPKWVSRDMNRLLTERRLDTVPESE